jgi:multidrug efflux pump subunit AcrB
MQLNNAPSLIDALGDLPIKTVNGAMVYIRDVAHVHDGNPPQTNVVQVDGRRSVLMQMLKNSSVSTLAIVDGIKHKVLELRGLVPDAKVPMAIIRQIENYEISSREQILKMLKAAERRRLTLWSSAAELEGTSLSPHRRTSTPRSP